MSAGDPNWADVATAIGTGITALATIALAVTGIYVAATWQKNLRGTTKHQTAADVLEQARLFRNLFYEARSPWHDAGEFPSEYYTVSGPGRTPSQEADGWAFLYRNRWARVGHQMAKLAELRARAGAVLGEEAAQALEGLARKGRELHDFMRHRVEQIRVGEAIVSQWPNQDWVEQVKDGVDLKAPDKRDDAYSKEFEEKLAKLEKIVKPFI
jgi:hypothetical protein